MNAEFKFRIIKTNCIIFISFSDGEKDSKDTELDIKYEESPHSSSSKKKSG